MKKLLPKLIFVALFCFSGYQMKGQAFTENFDDITTLVPGGWFMQNNSTTIGLTNWFQGNGLDVFPSYNGGINAYIGANFNNTTGNSTISNWLLTPTRTFKNGDVFTFYTRKPTPAPDDYPDRLQIRMSTNGASTNVGATPTAVGDFTTVLLEVNPTLVVGGYPITWTQYTVTISGLSAPTSGRIAFRYFVTNGGPLGINSDFIGIDNVVYTPYVCPTLTVGPAATALTGTWGLAYSSSFTQTGALGTSTFTITEGTLPAGLTLSVSGTLSGTPSEEGSFTFTVTVTDASGCTGSTEYTLDVAACEIEFGDFDDIMTECAVEQGDITVPVVTDSCGNNITPTTTATFPITSQGTTTIVWQYTDFYGNMSNHSQNIIIEDETAPVPDIEELEDITAECEVAEADITPPTATDNCDGEVTVTSDATFPLTAQGTTVIIWTFEDENGNTATREQNVIIEDTTGPELMLQDVTINLTEDGSASITAAMLDNGSSDMCGIDTMTVSPDTFSCDELGEQTVTVTATDVNGNISTATVTVTVTDTEEYCEAASVGKKDTRSFLLYPNPTNGDVTLRNPNGITIDAVTIYSLAGQTLYNVSHKDIREQYIIPMNRFQAGTYLMVLETQSGTITKRIVKVN